MRKSTFGLLVATAVLFAGSAHAGLIPPQAADGVASTFGVTAPATHRATVVITKDVTTDALGLGFAGAEYTHGCPEIDLLEIRSLDTMMPDDRLPRIPFTDLVNAAPTGSLATPLLLGMATTL